MATGWSTNGRANETAQEANLRRENEIRSLYDDIIAMYSPGGSFGAGTEAEIESQKRQYLGSATQSLISSGLYGSTMTAGLPKKFEEEVGMPARAKLEDLRFQQLSNALGQKAGFVERIEDQYPSYGLMANLQQGASSAPTSYDSSGIPNYGPSWLYESAGSPQPSRSTGGTAQPVRASGGTAQPTAQEMGFVPQSNQTTQPVTTQYSPFAYQQGYGETLKDYEAYTAPSIDYSLGFYYGSPTPYSGYSGQDTKQKLKSQQTGIYPTMMA